MFDLQEVPQTKWVTHDETETRFEIKPLSATSHNNLRNASMEKGVVNTIVFSQKAAVKLIVDWDGVGNAKRDSEGKLEKGADGKPILEPAECNEVQKKKFGARAAYNIAPWLVEQAVEFDEQLQKMEEDAKND